jgi:hypothetical protein
MKKNIFYFTLLLTLFSCEPRVKLDEAQWDLEAEISDIFMYTWQQSEVTLSDGTKVVDTKKVTVSSAYDVDSDNAIITLTVPLNVDRSSVSCYFYYTGESIEPLDESPELVKLLNWSGNSYKYRVNTAGEFFKDWTVNIVQ